MADYVVLSEVKDLLQDFQNDTTYDTLLGKLITRASRDVDRLTGQFFDLKTGQTKVWDGTDSTALILPWAWPLSTVTTLQVKAGGEGSAFVTVNSADYYLEPAGRMSGYPARWIELANRTISGVNFFPRGKGVVSILGDWGWNPTPDEIKELSLELIIGAFRNRGKGGHLPAVGVDPDMEPIMRSLSPRAIAILKAHGYKRPQIG